MNASLGLAATGLLLLAAAACGGPSVRGGAMLRHGSVLPGKASATLRPAGCHDGAGQAVQAPELRVLLIETSAQSMLVETRRHYDSLVIDNLVRSPDHLRFQVILDGSEGAVLRDFLLARDGASGQLRVATQFREQGSDGGRFTAEAEALALRCDLSAE